TSEEFSALKDIGPIMAESLSRFFAEEHNVEILMRLKEVGVRMEESPVDKTIVVSDSFFSGKKFVLTGNLEGFSRNDAEERIIALGGTCGSSVSRKTDYLIAGEKAGSKLQKASELGVPVLGEKDFVEKLSEAEMS
ncbi:MAG: NAD-dependent DNA ligase LigA, partial [Spirochaetota bacterium]|nr:NAD-dependent DNA ligase LigA [Spirochaetota bacterium]